MERRPTLLPPPRFVAIEQRLDFFVVIIAISAVDFGGDLQRHAAMLRDMDCTIDTLFRRDASEERKVGRLDRHRHEQFFG